MGISDLYDVIKDKCPEVLVEVSLSEFRGLSFAVDISIFLNKYVKTSGPDYWLASFIQLLCTMKRHGIKPVCIFDGPNPPIEKREEQDQRRAQAAKKRQKIGWGRKILEDLHSNYLPTNQLPDEELIAQIKNVVGYRKGKEPDITNYSSIKNIVAGLQNSLERQERQNAPILPIYSTHAKEIIEIMGFPHFQADGEAEALCAGLCCAGLVDGVITEDTDVLAYGTPFLLSKIDLSKEKVTVIAYEDILRALDFTSDQFRDLCILLGCDYNSRVKGYPPDGRNRKKPVSIGAKGAFCMINEYKSLEIAEEHITDADPLIYRRCRELFTPPTNIGNITIPYNGPIDKDRLVAFINTHKIRINLNYILDTWKPVQMVFNDGSDEEVEEDPEDLPVDDY